MDATSRNRILMVGGALVVVALLLVCGPLEGEFGKDRVESTPPVAAAPPLIEPEPEPEVVAVVPAEPIAADEGLADEMPAAVESAPVVPVVAAPVVASSGSKSPAPTPPPVSAAPPPVVPIVAGPSAAELAQNAFDAAQDEGPKSNLRDRFAPDVDSGPSASLLALDSFGQGNAFQIRPCDTPGAACRNPVPRTVARVPAGIPPIVPGSRTPAGGTQ